MIFLLQVLDCLLDKSGSWQNPMIIDISHWSFYLLLQPSAHHEVSSSRYGGQVQKAH